jgi:hypothetical protein
MCTCALLPALGTAAVAVLGHAADVLSLLLEPLNLVSATRHNGRPDGKARPRTRTHTRTQSRTTMTTRWREAHTDTYESGKDVYIMSDKRTTSTRRARTPSRRCQWLKRRLAIGRRLERPNGIGSSLICQLNTDWVISHLLTVFTAPLPRPRRGRDGPDIGERRCASSRRRTGQLARLVG